MSSQINVGLFVHPTTQQLPLE